MPVVVTFGANGPFMVDSDLFEFQDDGPDAADLEAADDAVARNKPSNHADADD